jgi:hypothetical protein
MGELERYRANLQKLREQAANYGMDVPLPLLNNIEFHEQKIRELEQSVAAAGEIFFQDDFASNQNGWPIGPMDLETGRAEIQLVPGALQIAIASTTALCGCDVYVPEFYGENFVLQFDATITAQRGFKDDAPAISVSLRYSDTTGFTVYLSHGCFSISKTTPNEEPLVFVDWRPCEPIRLTVGSQLRIIVKLNGPNLQLSAGDQAIFALNDSSIMGRGEVYIGGMLYDKNQAMTAEFRNLVIRAVQ